MRDLRDELGYDCDLCPDPEMGPPIPDPHGPLLHFHKPPLSTHDTCADLLREVANGGTNPMHGLQGALVVSDERPEITLPEFPPTTLRCPHGTQFWVYPDGARVAALRDLNYPTDRTETKP